MPIQTGEQSHERTFDTVRCPRRGHSAGHQPDPLGVNTSSPPSSNRLSSPTSGARFGVPPPRWLTQCSSRRLGSNRFNQTECLLTPLINLHLVAIGVSTRIALKGSKGHPRGLPGPIRKPIHAATGSSRDVASGWSIGNRLGNKVVRLPSSKVYQTRVFASRVGRLTESRG